MILVVWKYAKMHQNTFFTTRDVQKYLFWKKLSGGLEVCANASNTFLTTTAVQNHLFRKIDFADLEVWGNASEPVFYHSRRSKISFLTKQFLVVWEYAQMHYNTFLTTPFSKKYLFWKKNFLVVWEMHQNTILTTPDGQKYLFWQKGFWWYGSMRKCMKKHF